MLDYQAPALLHAWAVQLCETQSTTGSDCIAPLDKVRAAGLTPQSLLQCTCCLLGLPGANGAARAVTTVAHCIACYASACTTLPALHSLPAPCPPLLPLALLLGLQSRILWAYAQLGVYQPVLCDRLLQRLTAKEISRMGHAAVAALLWACAKLQHQPPG